MSEFDHIRRAMYAELGHLDPQPSEPLHEARRPRSPEDEAARLKRRMYRTRRAPEDMPSATTIKSTPIMAPRVAIYDLGKIEVPNPIYVRQLEERVRSLETMMKRLESRVDKLNSAKPE